VSAVREVTGNLVNFRRRLIIGFFLPWLCEATAGAAALKAEEIAAPFVQKPGIIEISRGLLEPIRQKHGLPALGAAVVKGEGLQAIGVVGVRKAGTDVPATAEDLWHLGSDTKAMTSWLIGALVEQGKLTWETTVGEMFPELAPAASPEFKRITLRELLTHRSGLPANIFWGLIPRSQAIREQRLAAGGGAARGALG
jgi:CubicO group peptidase (beta-lactamase class C family)